MFCDGLGRAADSSFVTPQPFDVLPGFGVNNQTVMEIHTNWMSSPKAKNS